MFNSSVFIIKQLKIFVPSIDFCAFTCCATVHFFFLFQYLKILGKPLICYTIEAFERLVSVLSALYEVIHLDCFLTEQNLLLANKVYFSILIIRPLE